MIDKNIKRFCEVISEINLINNMLDRNRASFYDGGHSFEEVYEYDIRQLIDLQNELKFLLKNIQAD